MALHDLYDVWAFLYINTKVAIIEPQLMELKERWSISFSIFFYLTKSVKDGTITQNTISISDGEDLWV